MFLSQRPFFQSFLTYFFSTNQHLELIYFSEVSRSLFLALRHLFRRPRESASDASSASSVGKGNIDVLEINTVLWSSKP